MSKAGPRPEDAVQLAQQAMQRLSEMEDVVEQQADTIEELEQRVQELVAAQVDASDYESLDREDKVGLVRAHLVKKAQDQRGKAQIGYQGIRWEVFDGQPSAGHCYTLMEQAAQERGFSEGTNAENNKTVNVQMGKISHEKKQALLSRANNGTEE